MKANPGILSRENLKDVQVIGDKLSAKVDGLDDEMTGFDKRLTALEGKESLNVEAIDERLKALENPVPADAAPEPDKEPDVKKGK